MKKKLVSAVFLGVLLTGIAYADGSETLGIPSIPIALGTGVVGAGVGMYSQPALVSVDVPMGATVEQVLVYWNGFRPDCALPPDDQITVNGNNVIGTLIGGPDFFFTGACSSTFRADITGLGLVAPGANLITLDDMDFERPNGASIIVIIDDGSDYANIEIRDGDDTAYIGFPPPRFRTIPQTFTFAPSASDRTAELTVLAGSVVEDRPNVIRAWVNGATTEVWNLLASVQGAQWDHAMVPLLIPAGMSSVTAEVQSEDDGSGRQPASLTWIGGILAIEPPRVTPTPTPEIPTPTPTCTPTPETPTPTPTPTNTPPPDGEGCTPGYWKNHLGAWPPTGYSPSDDFDTTFGVDFFLMNKTLLEALNAGGGGVYRLGRHGTAALLNAAHPDVNYAYSVAEVIALVQAGDADALEMANESFCPLPGWLR